MRKLLILGISTLILSTYSCEKDDLTVPTRVDIAFSMDSFTVNGSTKSGSSFVIDEGTIVVESIDFDGRRDAGDDYFFTSEFETPLKSEMHNRLMNQYVSYDVPQGVYSRIEFNLSLGDGNEDALCLKGKYHRGPIDDVPIRFEYEYQEQIRIMARNRQNSEQIVLDSKSGVTADIIFDVPYLFKVVSMNMIHNAETVQIDGEEVILINNEFNTDIFYVLVARLDNSMRVIFE